MRDRPGDESLAGLSGCQEPLGDVDGDARLSCVDAHTNRELVVGFDKCRRRAHRVGGFIEDGRHAIA